MKNKNQLEAPANSAPEYLVSKLTKFREGPVFKQLSEDIRRQLPDDVEAAAAKIHNRRNEVLGSFGLSKFDESEIFNQVSLSDDELLDIDQPSTVPELTVRLSGAALRFVANNAQSSLESKFAYIGVTDPDQRPKFSAAEADAITEAINNQVTAAKIEIEKMKGENNE
jgi:hypothetical protein